MDRESLLERETQEDTRTLRIRCWAVICISVAGSIIFAVAIALSAKVESERRIFMATILGVTQLCCILMLIVARNSRETLNVFIIVCAYVAGLLMGPVWCL
jgi:predicted membrane channel-forming protein YqfA (hemolysin III family)